MKIILIGFMGTGKSTVAALVAEKLEYQKVEMDELVLEMSGKSSIAEIFDQDGEGEFRRLEGEVAAGFADLDNVVISTGGGVGVNEQVLARFREGGKVVLLKSSFDVICERIGGREGRPLFRNMDEARKLYEHRAPLYQANADIVVEAEGEDWVGLAEEVIRLVQGK